jgi:hypothetical protein
LFEPAARRTHARLEEDVVNERGVSGKHIVIELEGLIASF